MKKLITTLGKIRDQDGASLRIAGDKLLFDLVEKRSYNKSREVSLNFILNEYGLNDAIWITRCFPELAMPITLYALWWVERVRHLMTDERSTNALDITRRYLTRCDKDPFLSAKEIRKLSVYTQAKLKEAAEKAKEAAIKAKEERRLFPYTDLRTKAIAKRATANAARAAWLVAISAAAACDERDHVCDANYSEGLYVSGDTLYDVVYSAVHAASESLWELTKEERAREEKAQTEEFLRLVDCIENGIEYTI